MAKCNRRNLGGLVWTIKGGVPFVTVVTGTSESKVKKNLKKALKKKKK